MTLANLEQRTEYPVILEIDSIAQFIPPLITIIPCEGGVCDAEEKTVERRLDENILSLVAKKHSFAYAAINEVMDVNIPCNPLTQGAIATIKDQAIKLDIIRLAGIVQDKYLEQLIGFGIGIEDVSLKVLQMIEIPFTLLDLYPGETQIHYKIYTKRELYVI